jgi:hypothetical protein
VCQRGIDRSIKKYYTIEWDRKSIKGVLIGVLKSTIEWDRKNNRGGVDWMIQKEC